MALHYNKITTNHKKKAITLIVVATLFGGGVNANAGLKDGIVDAVVNFLGKGFSTKDNELLTDRITVASSQTAIAPSEISEMMQASTKALVAAQIAEKQAFLIKSVIDGQTFYNPQRLDPETGEKIKPIVGAGLSSDLNCEALADKTLTQSKEIISDVENYNAHRRLAQLYNANHSVKQTNRVTRHIENYCDVTEVAQGACSLSLGNSGSADTNYSMMYSTNVLSSADVDAGVAFTLNIIDPASTVIEGCSGSICQAASVVNTSYQALANVSQGAFLAQMTDRMYYEFQGSRAGKELGKSTNVVVGGGVSANDPNTPAPTDPNVPVDPNAPVVPVDPNAPPKPTEPVGDMGGTKPSTPPATNPPATNPPATKPPATNP